MITFTINGTECQAEEGMTFYDWAMSEYYDDSCPLEIDINTDGYLRDDIINGNVSSSDSIWITYGGGGSSITPDIYTDTIIQSISYTLNNSAFG